MSLIDKMSQMFDDLMEKAIEHHRQSSPFRRNMEKKTVQDIIPTEEAEAAGADVDDALFQQKEARRDRKEAERRLSRAKNNLITSNLAYNLSPSNATLRTLQRAKKERKRSGRVLHQSKIAEAKAPNRLRKAREKLANLGKREEVVEGPPTKEQKALALGRTADSLFDVKGLTGSSGETIAQAATGNPAAMVKLVTDQIKGIGEGLGKTMNPDARGGESTSGLFKAGYHGAMLSGPTGMMVAPFLKLGEVITGTIDKIRDWNEGLHEANMKWAEFSGGMSAVAANQMARDIDFSQERGDARAESAERLAQSKHRLNQAMAPLDDAWANFRNEVASHLSDVIVPMVKLLKPIADVLNSLTTSMKSVETEVHWWGIELKKKKPKEDRDLEEYNTTALNKFFREAWEDYGRRKR